MPARYSTSALMVACVLASTAGAAVTIAFQTATVTRAADIHPESLSRVPPVDRASLDADGQRIYDALAGGRPLTRTGPAAVSMYSPKAAEPVQALNQYLRKSVVGSRFFELSALIAAREIDQQYEWSGHEPAGLKAGLEQSVIDVVKFNRPVTGLSEKDATVILLGRALMRDHKVSSQLWAKTVELFGRQGAIEITLIMGDYVMAGMMLTAVDQQLPAGRPALLPVK
jgi:4-carboxymuconolactone decarboxylase